jgi:hypothetical protein
MHDLFIYRHDNGGIHKTYVWSSNEQCFVDIYNNPLKCQECINLVSTLEIPECDNCVESKSWYVELTPSGYEIYILFDNEEYGVFSTNIIEDIDNHIDCRLCRNRVRELTRGT